VTAKSAPAATRAHAGGPSRTEPRHGWLASGTRAFALIFAALWLLHLPFLRLPYFWDEAGYFIPAARDLLLTGDLIPHTTLSNAHPPLVMIWLALCWKLAGYSPLVTRTAMLLVAASGFTALWLMARRLAGSGVAAATVLLTALSPTVFTQSAMAQLDIAGFALVLWTLYAYLCGRRWQAITLAALGAVAKETTLAVPLTLFAVELVGWFTWRRWPAWAARWCQPRKTLPQMAAWALAPLPLGGWYAYHFHRTGYIFGNPDYLRYNVGATLTPWRILLAFVMRLWHAVGYMNLFVLTGAALLLWWNARREAAGRAQGIAPHIQLLFALVVLAQVAEFSLVGGALLARYMIPAIPLVILLSVDVLRRSEPRWTWIATACAAAFVAALLFNPPWSIAPEDNLTWTHFVALHRDAARYAEQHYAGERILTAWPASDELSRPFLGYVRQPLTVVPVENFTSGEMLHAREQEDKFDVVLAFSTKFEPRLGWIARLPFYARWRRAQKRYFDYHQDLPPQAIAHLLNGSIVWRESSPGEWIALIEIDKVRNARAELPSLR
jgi:Dolichyl-phosphate-mannose-protein mannosyltransferase